MSNILKAGIAALVGLAAGSTAMWYYASRPEPALVSTTADVEPAPTPPAPSTLAASGPQALQLTIVPYVGGPVLKAAQDPTGTTATLIDIYRPLGINITVVTEPTRPDLSNGAYLTDAQLIGLPGPAASSTRWTVIAYMLPRGREKGDQGFMIADQTRDRFAVFGEANPTDALVLRTTAHELGHALNLFHADGNANPACCDQGLPRDGTTIMNNGECYASTAWQFDMGGKAKDHLMHHPLPNVRPGGSPWGVCIKGHENTCR